MSNVAVEALNKELNDLRNKRLRALDENEGLSSQIHENSIRIENYSRDIRKIEGAIIILNRE